LLEHGAELHEVRMNARDRDRYILTPLGRKTLALHAKALVIDDDIVFVGSANLDPRSLRINTEMGLLVLSERFNENVRAALEVFWVANDQTLQSQPATSFTQRIEDWFFSHLPLEDEL
jgi:putative cardiolipin synthase